MITVVYGFEHIWRYGYRCYMLYIYVHVWRRASVNTSTHHGPAGVYTSMYIILGIHACVHTPAGWK